MYNQNFVSQGPEELLLVMVSTCGLSSGLQEAREGGAASGKGRRRGRGKEKSILRA